MRDLNTPTVQGKGYFGIGPYKAAIDNVPTQNYILWSNILLRCYSIAYSSKYPSYLGCTVCEEWLNFQNFAQWCEDNYTESFVLDKDILFKGNKVYSPTTCCFVPRKVNNLFIRRKLGRGVYPIGVTKPIIGFKAELTISGKTKSFGTYPTIQLAFEASKRAKEAYIKVVADEYKSVITQQCYDALYTYEVEITD